MWLLDPVAEGKGAYAFEELPLRMAQGRNTEAVALYERALRNKESAFAVDHAEVVQIRNTVDALRAAVTTVPSPAAENG